MHNGPIGVISPEHLYRVEGPRKPSETIRRDLGFLGLKKDRRGNYPNLTDPNLEALADAFSSGLQLRHKDCGAAKVMPGAITRAGALEPVNVPRLNIFLPPGTPESKRADLLNTAQKVALDRLQTAIKHCSMPLFVTLRDTLPNKTLYAGLLVDFEANDTGIVPVLIGHSGAKGTPPKNLWLTKTPLATRQPKQR